MLEHIEIQSQSGQRLILPFTSDNSGIVIAGIDGLGPVNATIGSSVFANADGGFFHTSIREHRNIVMTLALMPTPDRSLAQIRSYLYNYLMPSSNVKILLVEYVGIRRAYKAYTTFGTVESFETALFSRDGSASISILCSDPDFKTDVVTRSNIPATQQNAFQEIDYEGNVETGFIFRMPIHVDNTKSISITMRGIDGVFRNFDFGYSSMMNGDWLTIDSQKNQKNVTIKRGNTSINGLGGISHRSIWPYLQPGTNFMKVRIASPETEYFSIEYTPRYGGL